MTHSPVIRAENISKVFRRGARVSGRTLRDAIMEGVRDLEGKKHHPLRPSEDKSAFYALKDISFELEEGDVLGIIGPNGAGKSTLLKVLSRITAPTSGKIEIQGRVGTLLEVGTGFHPELTGRENIFLNGSILGMSRKEIQARFDEIVDFSGVEAFIDTPVKRYSSGMYTRLAFAVAAHLEPEVLIVDEVLAVGDVAFQKKSLGKMQEAATCGRTVLFVSHSMAAVQKICNKAMLLDKGQMVASGKTEDVIEKYLDKEKPTHSPYFPLKNNKKTASLKADYLRLSTASGEDSFIFKMREPWRIEIGFTCEAPRQRARIAVAVCNMGTPIATLWSEETDLASGNYKVTFPVDLPLNTQKLDFIIGLSGFPGEYDQLESIGYVEIVEAEGSHVGASTAGTGVLVANIPPAPVEVRS